MSSFDKDGSSIKNEDFRASVGGLTYDRNVKTTAKPEELQFLNQPEGFHKSQEKMGDKISLNDLGSVDKRSGKEKKPCEDFEEILELVGSESRYQKILLYGILCPIVGIIPLLALNALFMWDTPDHWCHVPGIVQGMSITDWKNKTLPREVGPDGQMRYSQCKMYDQVTGNITECQAGWEYDTSDYSSTVPSEFNWVCDRDHYATDCFVWSSIGGSIGNVIFGVLGDKYGRKPVFFATCLFQAMFTAGLFVPQHYTLYKAIQLVGTLGSSVMFTMPALISAEVSGSSYRAWIYAITGMIWVVGNSILPLVAMVCRDWFVFGCVSLAPGYLLFVYCWMLDESPRWQITKGKVKPAIKTIHKMAKINGRKVEPGQIEQMVNEIVEKQSREIKNDGNIGFWTLFSKLNLAKNTSMMCIAFTMNSILYFGVTLNTTKMAGNKFINYFLLSIIEFPGGWLAGKLVETTGRRWTQAGFFLLSGACCLVCAVAAPIPNSTIIVIIAALGIKFGISISSMVSYLQGAEIFPTQLRSTGTALASTVSSVASIFGPYIVYSGTVHVSIPYAVLVVSAFIGVLSAACLPETFKQNLPETIEDANRFGKDHKFWSYLPQTRDTKNTSPEKNKAAKI